MTLAQEINGIIKAGREEDQEAEKNRHFYALSQLPADQLARSLAHEREWMIRHVGRMERRIADLEQENAALRRSTRQWLRDLIERAL